MATSPPAEPASSTTNPLHTRRRIILAVVLSLHAFSDVVIGAANFFPENSSLLLVPVIWGCVFAQVALAAVWSAWAPASLFRRILAGLAMTAFPAIALTGLYLPNRGSAPAMVFAAGLFGQWLLLLLTLLFVRFAWGLRLAVAGDASNERPAGWQFGVAQLLILTACIAVLLGAGRWLLSGSSFSGVGAMVITVSLLTVFNTMSPLPTIWACFASAGRVPVWLLLAGIYSVAIAQAETQIFEWAQRQPVLRGFLTGTQLALFVVTAATLLAVRAAGFRLQR
ncbi:MAG: hypothetical protein KY475_01435 [Planctomycetes bacterium]|nr:hypothetical protein [Planctomycetota bacterium]